jgi:thiamine-phosphate pyrophosphorylase
MSAFSSDLGRGLYGILDLPPTPSSSAVAPRRIYEALFAAGVSLLQLRMKDATAAAMLAMLEELKAARPRGVRLIVNDRLDVALAGGADGVHLGQDDLPLVSAQRIIKECGPSRFIIGISTHDEAQAQAALLGEPDYIALGPIYATSSKQNPDPVVGPERLAALCRSASRPVVAIGGITLERVPAVVAAGAQFAAIISAVNAAPDVFAAAALVQSHFCS